MTKTEINQRNRWYALAMAVEEAGTIEDLCEAAGFSETSGLYSFLRRNGQKMRQKYGPLPFATIGISSQRIREFMEE